MSFSLSRCTLLAAAIFAIPAFAANEPAVPGYVGSDQACLMCHAPSEKHPLREVMRGPHGKTGMSCESCHGPSAAHLSVDADGHRPPPPFTFDESDPESDNKQCLSCHTASGDDMHYWEGSLHQLEGLSCASCHDGHAARDTMQDAALQNAQCLDCHSNVRAEVHRRSAHPLRDGQQACTTCHTPHGSNSDAMLAHGDVNETCYSCHAEKRGPFLWEHPPARENCMNCHEPHGSTHQALMTARTPWLCQQCHSAQFHPSTALSGTGLPSSSPSQLMLARDCMNCHTQVHGSNHPSGPGQTR